MISMEFTLNRIGDLCNSSCSGGTPKSTQPAYYEGGTIPWLTTSEVNFNDIYDTDNKITQLGLEKSSAKFIPVNSVIVAMYGVTAGRSAINKIPLTTNQACCNLQINEKKANYRYVYYYLMMQSNQLNKLANGGAQQNLNSIIIKKFKILIPSLENQIKIAKVLNSYDQLIENNNKRIKLLESMAEELYKEWFVKKKENCSVKKLGVLMKDYFNGGWGKDTLESKEKNKGYVIRGTDIPDILNSCYDNIPLRYHSNNDIKNKQLEENDIIMELSNGNINNIGRTLLITTDMLKKYKNLMRASFCKTMRFNSKKDSLSALLLIRYLQDSGKMFFYKNTGTNGINNFNFKRFLRQDIYILDDDIFSKVCNLYELANNYRQRNYNLSLQRDSLLPRLMSGKLSVEGKEVI